MSELKKFAEITKPDKRQQAFEILDSSSKEYRSLTIKDFYSVASSIQLHNGVPEEVRIHFSTAKNLLVYSWFYYPFNVTAEFMAYVSLEFALKARFKPPEKTPFKKLIEMAVNEGIVRDEGFSHIQQNYDVNKLLEVEKGILPEKVNHYTKILLDTLPWLRNDLAHGSQLLHNNGAFSVRICAEFINQLFPIKVAN